MDREKVLRFLIASVAIVLLVRTSTAESVEEHVMQAHLSRMLDNVVVIIANGNNNGYGFIIGRSHEDVWVATAAHVVFPNFEVGQTLAERTKAYASLAIKRGYDSRTWPAGPPEPGTGKDPGTREDLAFFPVKMPLGTADGIDVDWWTEKVVDCDPKVGDQVWIAGQRGYKVKYSESSARIISLQDGALYFEEFHGEAGQSGAPVATARGFVGMYLRTAGQRVLPLARIGEAASAAIRPYKLECVKPRPQPVQLCLKAKGVLPSEIYTNGLRIELSSDGSGCVQTTSGHNDLSFEAWVQCVPTEVDLTTEPEQKLSLRCFNSPEGTWVSSRYGFLDVQKREEANFWAIRGLELSPYGELVAILRGEPPNLFIEDGKAFNGVQITGVLTLEARRMYGKLLFNGTPLDIEVSR